MGTSARRKVLMQPLSRASLAKHLKRLLPAINDYCAVNHGELLGELSLFGIQNAAQLRRLILQNRREAIRIDREPLDAVNAKIYRTDLGSEEYLFMERRKIFFGHEGLLRLILELEFGDRYRRFADERDHVGVSRPVTTASSSSI